MYNYALNNPLLYTDPSGNYIAPFEDGRYGGGAGNYDYDDNTDLYGNPIRLPGSYIAGFTSNTAGNFTSGPSFNDWVLSNMISAVWQATPANGIGTQTSGEPIISYSPVLTGGVGLETQIVQWLVWEGSTIVGSEYFSDLSLSGDINIYEPGSSVYNFSKAADIRQEGIGINASYSVSGGYRIFNERGTWKLSVTGVGHTGLGDKYGTITFTGGAQLLVNGQVTGGQKFVNLLSELYTAGSFPMGMSTFILPASGIVQLRITASYSINTGAGILTPIPMSIPPNYTMGVINIPAITTLRIGPTGN